MHIYTYKSIYKKRRKTKNITRPALSKNVVSRGKIKKKRNERIVNRSYTIEIAKSHVNIIEST